MPTENPIQRFSPNVTLRSKLVTISIRQGQVDTVEIWLSVPRAGIFSLLPMNNGPSGRKSIVGIGGSLALSTAILAARQVYTALS